METGSLVIMVSVTIPGVCQLVIIEDPSSNVLGVANYAIV